MKLLSIILCFVFSGCAVCEQHPTACKVGAVVAGAVIVGAIARRSGNTSATRSQIPANPDCSKPGLCN